MSKLFFDHLVIREEIEIELNGYNLLIEDKQELIEITDKTITSQILNLILNHLPKDKHQQFISAFTSAPHDQSLLEYLKTHAHPQIETEIKKHASRIKKEIITEIKKHSRKRKTTSKKTKS